MQALNKKTPKNGAYVLYWMQAAQRAEYNHALEYAIWKSNKLKKPLIVYFGLTEKYPEANLRHYYFMLEGLKNVQSALEKRGIQMIVKHTSPEVGAIELSNDASLMVADKGYLKIQKDWTLYAAEHVKCPLYQVETNVIVPVEEVSLKEEYAAAPLRPKIMKELNKYLILLSRNSLRKKSLSMDFASLEIKDIKKMLRYIHIDKSVEPVKIYRGGINEAKKHLEKFIANKLASYPQLRNDPTIDSLSNMSPYLHFGQISPLYIALKVLEAKKCSESAKETFLEELIVRRELSMNFVYYNSNYDSYKGLPQWVKNTLNNHRDDHHEYLYSLEELEKAQTHDIYWNAAQKEMMINGKMHGYMRMYWGKKIIEWVKKPELAYNIALKLNNLYELDGRDPNGFTGVAWCFGKHDRPWGERPIFGTIRYMNENGLKRKFDANRYVSKIEQLEK